jgi:hypothetical protein
MKKVIFALGIVFSVACSKTEVPVPPPTPVAQEEAIKFTTNLDTGTYNVSDTLPLIITVSSKAPVAGFLYSVFTTWTDSSKQIFKLDTTVSATSLSLNIPGLKKTGTYSLSITITSKSTTSNTLNKSISLVNNPLGRFQGYKVASNAKQLGFDYWYHGTVVMGDLITQVFQTPYGTRPKYGTFFNGVVCGDFNNDGWVDVFNAGANYNGVQAPFDFLIWNTSLKKFEEKNLFNDKSFTSFGGNKHTIKPFYLNDDNYIDLLIFDNGDEGIPNSPNELLRVVLSDGKGGYDLKEIATYEKDPTDPNKKEKGEMGDLNGDGILDLVLPNNMSIYIYWGIKDFPFITQANRARFVGDFVNFGNISDNGFGEKVPYIAGNAYTTFVRDINNDGKNDIIVGKGEEHNHNLFPMQPLVLINQGSGKFNSQSIIKLPFYYENDNINVTIQDIVVEDMNNDGLKDIIAVNDQMYKNPNSWAPWSIYVYVQQKDGSFLIDKTYFEYTINATRLGGWKPKLVYADFNGDGIKDIGYMDSADNGELKSKSVFIRTGNKFIETDFYQFDPYAKSIKTLIKN